MFDLPVPKVLARTNIDTHTQTHTHTYVYMHAHIVLYIYILYVYDIHIHICFDTRYIVCFMLKSSWRSFFSSHIFWSLHYFVTISPRIEQYGVVLKVMISKNSEPHDSQFMGDCSTIFNHLATPWWLTNHICPYN